MTILELLLVAVIATAVLALGIGVGMLLARPIARWAARDDEERHDV
jgi:hypothetical protein